jgi:hypothetical protein
MLKIRYLRRISNLSLMVPFDEKILAPSTMTETGLQSE